MDPNKDPKNETNDESQQSTAGAATAQAKEKDQELTRIEDAGGQSSTQNVLSEADSSHTEEVKPGAFGPLRYFVNSALRNSGEVTVRHGEGPPWIVQELTMEGQLRLKNPVGDNFALVPLDERYIPDFFEQIL